ncbi:signal recognition particle-docking protein FtsY [Hydrogenobacter sp. T-2]|uniref:signal recognition particle-docking protein FtsY n=1 Tax=Pampinifervens diazotrophicum TaxID=1632018 RepID=UPI002B25884F|nr:signal recognition particle-docking protein FtsY [Hydrogenobacter sp. T-2]WPM32462.1 signal recognition particle-docking protein FtsY [Hydrogenobacter sp. T-2]
MFFWRKTEEEKLAERGDKNAILTLIEKGKKDKAIEILERFKENPELRGLLFRLYMEEGKYYYAYQLIEHYDPELATAKEKALIYERVGELEKSATEYAKLGDWESLKRAGLLLYEAKKPERALELLNRSLKLAPALKRQEVEEVIRRIQEELGLIQRESFLEKLKKGLKKTKEAVEFGILFAGRKIDEELFEELEEKLIKADVGAKVSLQMVEELRKEAIRRNLKTSDQLAGLLKGLLLSQISKCEGTLKEPHEGITLYLFLGVNGSGKTTTIGKLAYRFVKEGKRVLLVAGDTFRSAAIEQLEVWAQRSGADIFKKHEGADPASVVYEALQKATSEGYQVVLVDTAGRLHTKEPLIRELRKIRDVIKRFLPQEPTETLLVLDATIGQNSIQQAKVFKEAVEVSGLILTKLDGSAKGGAIVPICRELGIPVKLIGVGEGIEDLQPFVADAFIEELIS